MTIQQAFNGTAQSLSMFGVHIPITPDIVSKIRSVALEMSNSEDLTTGIHPFTFAYLESSEIAEAYAVAEHYKMLHDDRGMPTLQDAIVLATPSRVKLPRSLSEAMIYFQYFRVALHVLLGSTHALRFVLASLEHESAASAERAHPTTSLVSNVGSTLGTIAHLTLVCAAGDGKRRLGSSQLRGAPQPNSPTHALGTYFPIAILRRSHANATNEWHHGNDPGTIRPESVTSSLYETSSRRHDNEPGTEYHDTNDPEPGRPRAQGNTGQPLVSTVY
jgi:hypothetical protein